MSSTRLAGLASLSPLSWALRAPLFVLAQAIRSYYVAIWFIDSIRDRKQASELTVEPTTDTRHCMGCPFRVATHEIEIGGVFYTLCDGCARRLA